MKNDSIINQIKNNHIRKWSKIILNKLYQYIPKKIFGYYYQILHNILIILGTIVILFSNNIYHLLICLNIITLDGLANIITHDCPLTKLEKKYLKTSLSHNRKKIFKKCNILYKCNHNYETQLELIINVWTIIACKIIILIFVKTFQININSER